MVAILARGVVVSPSSDLTTPSDNPTTSTKPPQAVVQITPNAIGKGDNLIYNPSFDVTPAKLITCVVTEVGVAENAGDKDEIDLSKVL
ncbi:hypothetical protein QFC22_001572 [Naganishia vaughanmartiniae]|uniref:Uncharacterized protein n=1 Tax=Naganishia vaughanmartiniae TaxID=1424756 RepID=A0ACC2XHQ8_9TREE|nr:hypothetical protein QFC22_001572 [Naganishia vaughanmartiniae]